MSNVQEIRAEVGAQYRREGSLYAVLQTQYRVKVGRPLDDAFVLAELSPFLHLSEEEALAAFTEYTVFKASPAEADVILLETLVRRGLRLTTQDEREILKDFDSNGKMFHWGLLLEASSDIKPKRLFQNIKWGMGKKAIVQLFSGKQRLAGEDGYNEIGFFSPSYGLPASFFFYYATGILGGDKLRRVQIMYLAHNEKWPLDEEIKRASILIKNDLIAQYGEPTKALDTLAGPMEFKQSELLVWKLPQSILTFSYGLVSDGVPPNVCPPLAVGYGDRKNDPASLPFDN